MHVEAASRSLRSDITGGKGVSDGIADRVISASQWSNHLV